MPRLMRRNFGITRVTVEIVILAMVAAFLGLRLYSVLGRKAEHEEEVVPRRFDPKPDSPATVPAHRGEAQPQSHEAERFPPGVERGLREIAAADRRFDALSFMEGARSAYAMILEAFWRGDREELARLCDRDVLESFVAAIDARKVAGETLDNRLVRIESSAIVAASLDAPVARITIRFSSDIAAVTRDSQGQVIAGSLTDAVQAIDVWTFSRNVASQDPDWLLDETDEG